MDKSDIDKRVADFIENGTMTQNANELFATTDGQIFYRRGHANNHALDLKDKAVHEYKVNKAEKAEMKAEKKAAKNPDGSKKSDDDKKETKSKKSTKK